MNSLRVGLATIGVAVAVAGLAMIVDPSLAGTVPSGEQVVAVIGLLAGIQGGRVLWHRYQSDLEVGTVEDDPETVPAGPSPGADFDELATAAGTVDSGRTLRSRRNRLRRRLRRAIVASLRRHRDLDQEEAVDAVETGTWTDDPVAAALFTDEAVGGENASGILPQSSAGTLTRRGNRAAVALAEQVGVDTGDFGTARNDGSDRRKDETAGSRQKDETAGSRQEDETAGSRGKDEQAAESGEDPA